MLLTPSIIINNDSGLLDLLSGPGLICILSTNLSTSHLADYFCVQVEVERSLPPGRLPWQPQSELFAQTLSSLCPLRVCFPALCKIWWVYGGVNSDLLQKGLCHTQVCCTQSPCPCSSSLSAHNFAGDTQTQFCLSLCGVSGSWCAQGLFESSERLWWVWNLILNMVSPLLPIFWASPLPSKSLKHHTTAAPPTILLGLLCPWTWGIKQIPLGGHKQKLVCTRTQEKGAVTPTRDWPRLACECLGVPGRGMGRRWPPAGLGALRAAVHAWGLLKEVAIIFITSTIVWPQVK